MTRKRLLTRPDTSTRYTLSEAERYALCVFCVFETTKIDAFKLAHPEVVGTKNVLKSRCDEFFASSDVVNFMREYRAYLDGLDKEEKTDAKANVSQEDREERKRRALEILADDLIDQIFALRAGGEEVDRETIMKMVDRIGWLGDEEVRVESPRRYLPTSCGGCSYKAFCEQECEDLCVYCKFKAYANEQGVDFPKEKQLEMPTGEKEE